jgi:hypothetical protein
MAEAAAMSGAEGETAAVGAGAKLPAPGRETRELLDRAAGGDEGSRRAIRALFADGDRGRRYLEHFGSPAHWLKETIVRKAAGENVAAREAIARTIEAVAAELAGPDPTPIERLLAERAALCWMLVNWYENSAQDCDRLSVAQANYHELRVSRAHGRFLAAVRTLAQVRRLASPSLQVNIAKNQVNVTESRP